MRSFAIPKVPLAAVIVGLLVLTAVSLGVSYLHLPGWAGVLVALGIAALKGTLVMLFFMELAVHGGGVRLAALVGPAFLAVMVFFILGDIWLR